MGEKTTDADVPNAVKYHASFLVVFSVVFVVAGLAFAAWALGWKPEDQAMWVIVGATLCYVGVTAWLSLMSWGSAWATNQMVAEMQRDRELRYAASVSVPPVALKTDTGILVRCRNLSATPLRGLVCRAWRVGHNGPVEERYGSVFVDCAPYEWFDVNLIRARDDAFI